MYFMTIDLQDGEPVFLFKNGDATTTFHANDVEGMADYICKHNIETFMHSSTVDFPEDAGWPENLWPHDIQDKVYEKVKEKRGFKLLIGVRKISVLISHGTDTVFIHTTCPCPFPPSVSEDPMTMKFEVQKGKGIQYVRDVFDVEPEVIDVQN